MLTDSLPLVSVAAVKAALATASTATTAVDARTLNTDSTAQVFNAKVLHSTAQPPTYLLALQVGREQIQLTSQLPLPTGTELTLSVQDGQEGNPPKVSVLEILLPATQSATQPATTIALSLPAHKTLLENIIQPFIRARLPLLTTPSTLLAQKSTLKADTYRPASNMAATASTTTNTSVAASRLSGQGATPAPLNLTAGSPLLVLLSTLASAPSAAQDSTATATMLTTAPTQATASAATTPLATITSTMPAETQALLKQWQQSLPSFPELASAERLQHSVQRSGLNYEHQLMALLPTLAAALSHQTNSPMSATVLFKQLWSQLAAQTTALTASEQHPATANSTGISQLLAQVKNKLETGFKPNAPAAETDFKLPSALQTLLAQDAKAVLSRALLSWANYLAANQGAKLSGLPLNAAHTQAWPEGLRLIQSALAHIEHEQTRQLLNNTSSSQSVDIPLYYQDQGHTRELRLYLEHDEQPAGKKGKAAKQVRWHLRLYFELKALGPLGLDLELQLPKLKATFWSKQSDTLQHLNQALQPLRHTLAQLGVDADELQVRHGQLPEPSRNHIHQRLVDTHS